MSIESAGLLRGWMVDVSVTAPAPVRLAAEVLRDLGATQRASVTTRRAETIHVEAPGRSPATVALSCWTGEAALAEALDRRGRIELAPEGQVLTAFAGLVLAATAVAPPETPRTVHVPALVDELLAGLVGGPAAPEIVACRDGFVVARWREPDERHLFHALVGRPGSRSIDAVVAEARTARLLVAAVRRPEPTRVPGLGVGYLEGTTLPRGPLRIVDWTVLWAGPWAAKQLGREAARVDRIEHPRRRDGLLAWPEGERWWQSLNAGKHLSLLDLRRPSDLGRARELLGEAHVLLTSMTPRALLSLGFDDDWRQAAAPGLLHVELVAFDGPHADVPGLGEHAAAEAGLLWREGLPPARPYPWADALLGATALALSRAWLGSSDRRGGRIRLSLERAARLAATPAGALDAPDRSGHTAILTG